MSEQDATFVEQVVTYRTEEIRAEHPELSDNEIAGLVLPEVAEIGKALLHEWRQDGGAGMTTTSVAIDITCPEWCIVPVEEHVADL